MNAAVEIQRFRVNRNAWKTNLTKEIIDLEDNLDQLFNIVGLKPHRILATDNSEIDDSTLVTNNKRLRDNEPAKKKQLSTSHETIIDEHFSDIQKAVNNICALITSVTEFDLPIPIQVLLRLAYRLNLLKWLDFRKKMTGSLSRKYVYTKSLDLIHASLKLSKWISIILGTNSLPFQTYINLNILNILEWTRTSDLYHHDPIIFFKLRSQILDYIALMIETLSTNITLEPKQLKLLIEVEIIGSLEELLWENVIKLPVISGKIMMTNGTSGSLHQNGQQVSCTTMEKTSQSAITSETKIDFTLLSEFKDRYSVDALKCLERLFICYADFLDAPLEQGIKSFVIQTCLKVYRDFERNVIGLATRRQFIKLVETIANRPYATSTTELAWHVFELADRMESDVEIKFIARRSIKVGLAHRPTIVSNYGVYNAYAGNLLSLTTGRDGNKAIALDKLGGGDDEDVEIDEGYRPTENNLDAQIAARKEAAERQDQVTESTIGQLEERQTVQDQIQSNNENRPAVRPPAQAAVKTNGIVMVEGEQESKETCKKDTKQRREKEVVEIRENEVSSQIELEEKHGEEEVEKGRPEDDPQVQSYLSLFVDKPAS